MSALRILIPDATFSGDAVLEREALAPVLNEPGAVLEIHRLLDAGAVPIDSWRTADAVIVASPRMTIGAEAVSRLERCRVIVRAGIGFDNIDVAACGERAIPVCNVPDYCTEEVASHALALALSLRRGLASYGDMLNLDPVAGWRWDTAPLVDRLSTQVFGIVGFGRIGRAAAVRARAFGLRILYYDPYVADPPTSPNYERRDSLEALLADTDIVSLHCPLTPETRGLMSAARFARMKPRSILVNTARGAVVDIEALAAGLRAGRPGGAALDVLPEEPPDPDHELIASWRMQPSWLAGRLLLSPHAAFYSPESLRELRLRAAATVCDALLGRELRNCVNRSLLKLPEG
ncbi:MAG TPA: C-terminal binding protein [Alphaproteobacteria bacterium]